uniref:P3 n=1 Tax=Pelargonium radula virus 1 TaxID=2793734 RepID=A0A8D9PGV0_9RHAB|nr:TPA_asm: P3 [Pelargonium radula virus 1]
MSPGLVSVNDARIALESDGSLTALIGSSSVYDKKHASCARKKEVNVKVVSSDGGDLLMRNVPLFDEHDLKEMRNQSGDFKYIHIGCITVSIEPLIHQKFLAQFGKSVRGLCVIFDSTFEIFEESIICAHKFDLSEGRADFICYPNHCLSASDENLRDRLSVLLCMDNIRVRKGNEMLTLCIGHLTTGTNTMNPADTCVTGMKSIDVMGASEIGINEITPDISARLEAAKTNGMLYLEPAGGDQYIRPRHHGIKKYFMKPPKVVIRRNFNTATMDDTPRAGELLRRNDPPRLSVSAPSSPAHNMISSTRTSNDKEGPSGGKFYIDGDIVKNAIKQKKRDLRSASSRYNKLQIGKD